MTDCNIIVHTSIPPKDRNFIGGDSID